MPTYKKRTMSKNMKQEVKKIAKRAVAVQQELKFADVTNTYSPSTAGTIVDVFAPTQGLADTSRVGDIVMIKYINFSYAFIGGDATNFIRVMLIQWKEDSGLGGPNLDDILLQYASYPWIAQYYHDLRQRVNVIYDKTHAVSNTGGYASFVSNKRIYKGFKKQVQFEAAGTGGLNKIYLVLISDSAAAVHPNVDACIRVTFTDS